MHNIDGSVVFLVIIVLLQVKLMNSVRFVHIVNASKHERHISHIPPITVVGGLIPLSDPCNTCQGYLICSVSQHAVHVLLLKHSYKKYPTIQRRSILSSCELVIYKVASLQTEEL